MAADPSRLIWVDMEMTGLSPESDRIIEVAIIITSGDLDVVIESPALVVHQDVATLQAMDSWNQSTHTRTGLIDKVKASTLDESTVENAMLAF